MSEGVSGAGMMRSQMRVYYSQNGSYSGASYSASSNNISIGSTYLCGKYFTPGNYTLTGVTTSQYTITAGPPSLTSRTGMPSYVVDQNGSETGTYTSGQ